MKIIYSDIDKEPLYISQSGDNQKLLLWFEDDQDWFVYYADDMTSQVFINRIIDKMLKPASRLFSLDNFEVIEDDEQFKVYEQFIKDNYNYQGLHK